jgi:hypothetical protein
MVSPTADRRFGLVGNTPMKAPVTVVAESNIALSGEKTIDSVSVLEVNSSGVPDRVLCVGQTDATQNGIYDVSTGSWSRSRDADGNYDLAQGTVVRVAEGGSNANTFWTLTTSGRITIGSTAMTWEKDPLSALTNAAIVSTMTAARAVDKTRYSRVMTTGYYADGDGWFKVYRQITPDGSIENGGTTFIGNDGGVWQEIRSLTEKRRYQVAPNKTILAPDGSRFMVKGVSMFDYLFVSNEARTNYLYRTIYSPAGKGSAYGISEPTYYARVGYKNPDYVETQLVAARAMGVNLIRVGVEPAIVKASVNYVDPNDGQTYPPDLTMLDEIVRKAGLLGIVVQLHNSQDMCLDSDTTTFLSFLALRYWDCPWVWMCPMNEPYSSADGGIHVNDTGMWKTRHDLFMPAIRNTLANGQKFLNPVVLNPPDYAHNLDGIAATLNSDTAFTLDPNLAIGIHVYQTNGQSDFRTTRIAGDTTAWYQYVDTYCLFIDENGIDNQLGRYDPNLDPGTPSVDLAEWARMQSFSTDFCQWCWEKSTLSNLNGFTGSRWFAYIPGLLTHDDNTMFRNDGAITTWGTIYRGYLASHSLGSLAYRRSLGADYATGAWSNGDLLDEAVTYNKMSLPWVTYTPTVTSGTGAITSYTATVKYLQVGKKAALMTASVTLTNNGTGATDLRIPLPVGFGNAAGDNLLIGANVTSFANLLAQIGSGTNYIQVRTNAGAYPATTGDTVMVTGLVQLP